MLGDLVVARLGLTLAISARRVVTAPGQRRLHQPVRRRHPRASCAELAAPTGPRSSPAGCTGIAGTADAADRGIGRARGPAGRAGAAAMGGPLAPLFYAQPLEIVRGEGPWLFAADGTRLSRRLQQRRRRRARPSHRGAGRARGSSPQLNTHSRYLHPRHRRARRAAARHHAGRPRHVLFTTSGTEANELAWRMATACTGGNAAIIAEHAYHGSSKWMADLSSNEWPPGYRPAHVGTFAAPRTADGGTDRQTASGRVAAAAADLAAAGDRAGARAGRPRASPARASSTPRRSSSRAWSTELTTPARCSSPTRCSPASAASGRSLWRFALAGITPGLRDPRQADGRRLPDRRADHPPRDRRLPGPRLRVLLDLRG